MTTTLHLTNPTIKVGPDGTGSYRYAIDGKLSVRFYNAASARAASARPQIVNAAGELEPTAPTPEADILRAASQILAKYRGGLATTLAILDETADYLHSQGL